MIKANLQSKHQNNFEAKFQPLNCEHALQNVSHTKNSKDYKYNSAIHASGQLYKHRESWWAQRYVC